MSQAAVRDIMRQIEAMSEMDRLALDEQLASRLEDRWGRMAKHARSVARRRNITQAVIDRAVARRR